MAHFPSAIVTGGGAGIGAEISLMLAKRGYHLTLVDRNEFALRETSLKM
jgi:short-subunit dehydrogenase